MAASNQGVATQTVRLLRFAFLAQLAAFVPLALLLGATGDTVIPWLFPDIDSSVVELALPLLIGAALWQFALLAHKPLEIRQRTRIMLLGIVIALALSSTINYWGLPRYGLQTAPWATIAGATFYLFFTAVLLRIPDRT